MLHTHMINLEHWGCADVMLYTHMINLEHWGCANVIVVCSCSICKRPLRIRGEFTSTRNETATEHVLIILCMLSNGFAEFASSKLL